MTNPLKKIARSVLRQVRQEDPRALFWLGAPRRPNFGDLLGPFLFRSLARAEPQFTEPDNRSLKTVFLTVGSIMHFCRDNCIVWGSGIITRDADFPRPQRVCSVRGPLTRRRFHELGFECPEVFGDPGLLLPRLLSPADVADARIGLVPHFADQERCRDLFGEQRQLSMIDVLRPVEVVIEEITGCEAILSSSLHGLIVAHAYGIPAAWIEFSDDLWGDGIKFPDHYASLGMDRIPGPARINRNWTTGELLGLVRDWPQPGPAKVNEVCDALLASCPFPEPPES